jgi:hypothetical protein
LRFSWSGCCGAGKSVPATIGELLMVGYLLVIGIRRTPDAT